ncbi:MAG: DMT family transporter, partial [Oligoflexia bacterium]|nr:DMT family transporter [Oligoflexia bacterium]
ESLRPRHFFSFLLALVGIAAITLDIRFTSDHSSLSSSTTTVELFDPQYLVGNVTMLLAVIAYSAYTILAKKLVRRWSANSLTIIPFLVAALALGIYTVVADGDLFWRELVAIGWNGWLILFYLGVGGGSFGYWVWHRILSWLSAREVGFSLYLEPILGPLFSMLLLKEDLSINYLIGIIAILLSMYVEQFTGSDHAKILKEDQHQEVLE